jgi:hypothetical protein
MYTLVHAVLLRELPFDEPERLVWMYNKRTERDRAPLSLPDVLRGRVRDEAKLPQQSNASARCSSAM